MIDIVIPFRFDRQAWELKYTLRSIEKNLKGCGTVFIVSNNLPKWVNSKSAAHLRYGEPSERTQFNIHSKLLQATNVCSDPFIEWHDDMMLLEPMSVYDFKHWYNRTLKEESVNRKGRYLKYCENTMEVHPDGLFFDIHRPYLHSHGEFQTWDKDYLINSLYRNRKLITEADQVEDLKIKTRMKYGDIKILVEGKPFMSTVKDCLNEDMLRVMNENFPNKSKYEI